MRQLRFPVRVRPFLFVLSSVLLLCVGSARSAGAFPQRDDAHYQDRLAEEVRHQLVIIPFLSVFDNLEYQVKGTEVTLMGQVTQPTVKTDALSAVKRIEGVTKVNDQIELLPVSPMDRQIRRAEFRAIYGFPALERYAVGALPPIRIVVKNGHVTLEGVVVSEGDKNIAGIRANTVPNVFSVTNNLRVEAGKSGK